MTETVQLKGDFQPSSERDWRLLVERSLQGTSVDTLAARSDDGLAVGPIYGAARKAPPLAARPSGQAWVAFQRLEDANSARATVSLAADIEGGAGGIELLFADSASAARTGFGLKVLSPRLVKTLSSCAKLHLRVDAGGVGSFYPTLRALRPSELSLVLDPLAHAVAGGGFASPLAELGRQIFDVFESLEANGQAGTAVEADGRVWAAGGASEAQELAAILASLVHSARLLIGAGATPQRALGRIGMTLDIGANQGLAVAKLRAARLLHARLVEGFRLPPIAVRLHAETSWRMMTRYDVHTNILRTTSAAFAAAVGGADSITVLPFTVALGLPDAFARRVARNMQIILTEESGLARVADPGAGAGAIETLTAQLAEAAWEKFRLIEAEGGLLAALRAGSFQRDIIEMRKSRDARIARRQIAITGVSEFPTLEEAGVAVLAPRPRGIEPAKTRIEELDPLPAVRLSEAFEGLRERTDALAGAGKVPKVFLANLGTLAEHAEAAQSARNLFAAGGIHVVNGGGFATPEAAVQAFLESGARAVCITGTAEALHAMAGTTASLLRAEGAMRVYLIGEAVVSADIDAIFGEDVDAVAALGAVLDALS